MIRDSGVSDCLVSNETSRALDREAQTGWAFNSFSLVEAAGRSCAQVFERAFPEFFSAPPGITIAAGAGNNGADGMVMLRYWLLAGKAEASRSALVIGRRPEKNDPAVQAALIFSLEKMGVLVLVWDEDGGGRIPGVLAQSDIIVDGIAGTGVLGPLRGTALEMANAVNLLRKSSDEGQSFPPARRPFVVSVDIPSGNSDSWEAGMPIVEADCTLAIEPQKLCVYTPAARPHGGLILPVGGVFPSGLVASRGEGELLGWEKMKRTISRIPPQAYKHERGTVEIRAGSPGATGAALIAARGAQAAGAGLVRLVTDNEIWPILASRAGGVMVAPAGEEDFDGRFKPDAILLGPGWGSGSERTPVLEKALASEKNGTPLVLDADAIELSRERVFCGNVILTPHPGELSRYTGRGREEILNRPVPLLKEYARARNGVILFKSHVLIIAAPDGRLGVLDGMIPSLAAGGSGDLLAGFCAAIAARMVREGKGFDGYAAAAAAAALLIATGKSPGFVNRFNDPLELADAAACLAGEAWLGTDIAPAAEKSAYD